MNTHKEECEQLNADIKYKEGYITSCELYPTDTTQFRNALDRDRDELRKMYAEKNRLESELAPLEPKEEPHKHNWGDTREGTQCSTCNETLLDDSPPPADHEEVFVCQDCGMTTSGRGYRLVEPTPPSQIEESIKSSFEQGYELGLEHGRELALKDLELLDLEKQLEAINKLTKEKM